MKVDLRSAYNEVYDQGPDPSCGPHAVTAALDAMYEHALGTKHRFNKAHLWWYSRFWLGAAGQKIGATFGSLEKALRVNGAVPDTFPIEAKGEPHYLVRTNLGDDGVAAVKRLLCLGVPVVYLMQITQGFVNLSGPWRTHTWIYPAESLGEHFVCIVGFDDECQRFLVENSWGPQWGGDGGFFGLPYDYLTKPGLMQGVMHIDVAPITPKPVDGYKVTVPAMLTAERAAFTDRCKAPLLKLLMDAFTTGGAQGLIDEAIKWGVSDKHIESLCGWERRAVRDFREDNPGLNWNGFIWDQL